MKKVFLALVFFVFAFVLENKILATPSYAYTQVGCSTKEGNYICNPNQSINGATCTVNPTTGQNAYWKCGQGSCSSTPTDADAQKAGSGCGSTAAFLNGYPWWAESHPQWVDAVYKQPDPATVNMQRYLRAGAQDWIHNGIDLTAGDLASGIANGNSGALGFFASNIDFMIRTKPASSIDYVAYEIRRLHVPGTPDVAYAADGGTGFVALQPILQIWTMSRNLAYIIFAVLFIVVGVMIMTRQKIDPKTVASVQNALPKMVFALVMITFSYAIAGFLIDLMYVSLGLIVTIITAIDAGFGQTVQSTILSHNLFYYVLTGEFWGTITSASSSINVLVQSFVNGAQGGNTIQGSILGIVSSGLAFLIILVALLIALFRTWFILLDAYAHIVLAIILAPLQLSLDAIPGQAQFSKWVREMLANLAAFPLVAFMLTLGTAIATNFGHGVSGGKDTIGFAPPMIGAGNAQAIASIVGLAIILTIPKTVDITREFIKAPKFKFGSAWSENVNAARAGLTTGANSLYAQTPFAKGRKLRAALNEKQFVEDNLKRSNQSNPGQAS